MKQRLDEQVGRMVERLLNDYNEGRTIDKVLDFDHPDQQEIRDILSKLQRILFPGYFKNHSVRVYTMKNNLTMLLEDVLYNLAKQIKMVLKYSDQWSALDEACAERASQELAIQFLDRIPQIRSVLETDLEAFYEGDPAAFNKDEIIFSYPGLFAVMVYRLAHELYLLQIPILPRMMTEIAHSQTGIDIHPGATIGKYFFIDHGTGIVVGQTTEIGEHVKIYQNVTLGALSTRGGHALSESKRHPTLGNRVTVYSGATILGGETIIGDDVVIGGNAFITTAVPAGSKVSLTP